MSDLALIAISLHRWKPLYDGPWARLALALGGGWAVATRFGRRCPGSWIKGQC